MCHPDALASPMCQSELGGIEIADTGESVPDTAWGLCVALELAQEQFAIKIEVTVAAVRQ